MVIDHTVRAGTRSLSRSIRLPVIIMLAAAGASCTKSVLSHPLTQGSAHVAVSGATDVSYHVPMGGNGLYEPISNTVALPYKDGEGDVFVVSGPASGSTTTTGGNFSITVSTGDLLAASSKGECTVTWERLDPSEVRGTAVCHSLDSSKGSIDVNATFSAFG